MQFGSPEPADGPVLTMERKRARPDHPLRAQRPRESKAAAGQSSGDSSSRAAEGAQEAL